MRLFGGGSDKSHGPRKINSLFAQANERGRESG
jgi:hypothetical protein